MSFTALETKVLAALIESAGGNGDDFGFTDDARDAVKTKAQLAGVIASLVKKGTIVVHEPERVNGTVITQFTWPEDDRGTRIIPDLTGTKK